MPEKQPPARLSGVSTNATQDPIKPPTLSQFLAWIRSTGLQKNNRFFLKINPPTGFVQQKPVKLSEGIMFQLDTELTLNSTMTKLQDVHLACEDISLPTKTLQTRTLRLNGLNEQRAHTIDYGGESGVTITFLVDTKHEAQSFFESWIALAVNDVTREIGEYKSYASKMSVIFLRPLSGDEPWDPYRRGEFGASSFKAKLKERAINLAANEVSKLKTGLLQAVEKKKQTILGKQLGLYNKLKGVLPLDSLLNDNKSEISDVAVYSIDFDGVFPKTIATTQLAQGSTEVYKVTVTFAFTKYTVSDMWKVKADSLGGGNFVMNFLKKAGLPTTMSGIGKAAIKIL